MKRHLIDVAKLAHCCSLAKRHLYLWFSAIPSRSEVLSHQHSADLQVNNRLESKHHHETLASGLVYIVDQVPIAYRDSQHDLIDVFVLGKASARIAVIPQIFGKQSK
jgi:hypothetical protein